MGYEECIFNLQHDVLLSPYIDTSCVNVYRRTQAAREKNTHFIASQSGEREVAPI